MEDDPFADLLNQIDSKDPPKASLVPSTQKQQTKPPKNPFDAFNVPFDTELNSDDPFDTSNIGEVWRNTDQISKSASPPREPIMSEDFSRQPESLYPTVTPIATTFAIPDLREKCAELENNIRVLQDKNQKLQRKFTSLEDIEPKGDSIIQKAVDRAVRGGEFHHMRSLHSLAQKKSLLEAAVESGRHDVILSAALFVKETLTPVLSARTLNDVPEALGTLISFYEKLRQTDKLIELYTLLNRYELAAMHMFNKATGTKNAEDRKKLLQRCSMKMREWKLHFEAVEVDSMISLYERQVAIEKNDQAISTEKDCEAIWLEYPRSNIIGIPTLSQISYCLLYHPKSKSGKLSNPKSIRDEYKIDPIAWTWLTMRTRAKVKDWVDVRRIAKKKGKLLKKSDNAIGFQAFVEAIVEFKGPAEELKFFTAKIANTETCYEVAMQHDFIDIAAEALLKLKDKDRLLEIRPKVLDVLVDTPDKRDELLKKIDGILAGKKRWGFGKRNKT